ncbi:hypothetical protein [Microvirga alba]|uniref:Uncharacterized protein n=1 Tax=Microvirga alba TaxID=2791025 RepID=A0A931BM42_9HYPH|nr:hypothetical protein [Microvirga alba]MBF9233396.1 hypothetical protein [Microvirga alba]
MLEIDLNAPTIPPEQRVWRLFPGSGYQFLQIFLSEQVGFLDLPAFLMPGVAMVGASDLIPRIALSQRAREMLMSEGADTKLDLKLDDFTNARHTQARGRIRQAIINFLGSAKTSDLLVLPGPLSTGLLWIGRFADDGVVNVKVGRRYGNATIPARKITWLSEVKENMVSSPLSQSLRQTHPFTLLERSIRLEVFSLAYGSFVMGDRHTATVYNANDYLDADAAFLGTVSRLAAAACQALDRGALKLDASTLVDLLLKSPPIEYTCSQAVDIHSPGFNRYTSGTIVALVIAALVATFIGLSKHSDQNAIASEMQNLVIINSSPNADPQCTGRVSEASKLVLDVLGIDKTLALCDAARKAEQRGGLRSTAKPKT